MSKRYSPACNTITGYEGIKQLDNFIYLESMMIVDGRCENEIRQRIGIEKSASREDEEYGDEQTCDDWDKGQID